MGIGAGPAMAGETVYGLTSNENIVSFDSAKPGMTSTPKAVNGLGSGENLLGIDFRPATGQLYGVTRDGGDLGRIYRIDPLTSPGATATLITSAPFALDGADIGFDFNPQADAIRIHIDQSATDDNLRVSPVSGNLVLADTDLAFAGAPDPNAGDNPNPVASAYSSNFPGTTRTKLYAIETGNQILVDFATPNNGVMASRGALGITVTDVAGFDIGQSGAALAALQVGAAAPRLYRVDLGADTNAVEDIGVLGNSANPVEDIAIAPRVRIFAALVNGTPQQLVTFRSDRPGTILSTSTVDLPGAETLRAIDTRQADGELYGLGSLSRIYRLNVSTGAATAVGSSAFTPALSGSSFGFDFNPAADRLRVVSDAEQNLRLNSSNGTFAATADTNLTPAGNVVGAAYTNPVEKPATGNTTLFGIDSAANQLVMQGSVDGSPNSPDGGAITNVGAGLGVDVGSELGYDIVPEFNQGFMAADDGAFVGTSGNLWSVNSVGAAPGTAQLIGAIGAGGVDVQGLAFLGEDVISIGSPKVEAGEGDGTALVTVLRSGGSDRSATVTVSTGSESAQGGFDFGTPSPTTLTFAAGETAKTVSVPVLDDVSDEPDESFLVRISAPAAGTGGASLGVTSAEVTIVDNDPTPLVPPEPGGLGRTFTGTDGNDTITGTAGDDIINCGAGNDVVNGGGGNDVINCGDGNDRVDGAAGDDRIDGGGGNDALSGGSGDDDMDGGTGKDRMGGGSGDDTMDGEAGADNLIGNSGNDRNTGGSGNDRVSGNQGDDRLSGNSGRDIVSGNSGDDRLSGGTGNDRLSGNSGDDRLSGNSGNDRLRGGSGRDRLIGGAGRDILRQS
ncbi:MAG: hypothetical protein QOG72_1900 [Sphingomonadales bacterium]|nr:hypothetical protein [Sphingomonadales bacterium]